MLIENGRKGLKEMTIERWETEGDEEQQTETSKIVRREERTKRAKRGEVVKLNEI